MGGWLVGWLVFVLEGANVGLSKNRGKVSKLLKWFQSH